LGLRRGLRWLTPAFLGIALAVSISLLGGAPGNAAQAPLEISISGNHFVNGLNGSGQTIQLRGVNVSSSEYACADNYGYDDGDYTDATAAAIAAWGANAVRIPLNEDCWLNTNLPAGDPYGSKAGKAKSVVLKLSKASRKLLAAKHSLKVRITVALTSAGHRRTVLYRTTTLHHKA
jgi:aryl-phospho-beta-D-glucosidase BglC (GH1 family)